MPDGFTRLTETDDPPVTIRFEGRAVPAQSGDSVAAALLAAGITTTRRTPVNVAPRGPFCMMGVCFECLMEIDGWPNRQACQVEVREGMEVRSMAGPRALSGGDDDDA